ncbi:protoporphyrinogen/coproporphyrinogen oxidase [Micropruina sp.]|uniref:protoporphyrinogen/coproporphyrinogen oxidase n=1 Tax=Micropruina sp. TaxID=2737536 RepID=UPI0039E32CE2
MSAAIVVGAGAGGLVAAWQFARAGWSVTLLDAWRRPGGLLGRADLHGLALDVGAESYSVRGGAVAALLAELGASDLIEHPNPLGAWLHATDGAHPIPKGLVFGLPSDIEAADVRAVVGDVPPARRPERAGSFADLVRAEYGQRVLDDLVTPLVGGVYSTDPQRVTLAELAPGLADQVAGGVPLREAVQRAAAGASAGGAAVHGIRGGMHVLGDLLVSAAEQTGRFELACDEPALAVVDEGTTWRVRTSRRELSAPALVLAVPLDVAARLLGAPVSPSTTRVEVITLMLDAPALRGDEPRGTGVLVGAGVPGVVAKALTHSTAKWAWLRAAAQGRDVLRLSYGRRGQAPATAGLDQAELARLAHRDAVALLGRPVPPPAAVYRTSWSILTAGTPGLAPARQWLTERRTARLGLVGAGVAGVGLAAVVPQARAEAVRLLQRSGTHENDA